MRLRDELEEGCTGVSVGAAAHGWHALPFPLAPFLSRSAGEEGGRVGPLTQWSHGLGTCPMRNLGF